MDSSDSAPPPSSLFLLSAKPPVGFWISVWRLRFGVEGLGFGVEDWRLRVLSLEVGVRGRSWSVRAELDPHAAVERIWQREIESSLLTTYWSESTISS